MRTCIEKEQRGYIDDALQFASGWGLNEILFHKKHSYGNEENRSIALLSQNILGPQPRQLQHNLYPKAAIRTLVENSIRMTRVTGACKPMGAGLMVWGCLAGVGNSNLNALAQLMTDPQTDRF